LEIIGQYLLQIALSTNYPYWTYSLLRLGAYPGTGLSIAVEKQIGKDWN